MEIVLTQKQLQVLGSAFQGQELHKQEFAKLQQKIDDVVLLILETHKLEPVQGIQIKEGIMIVPDKQVDSIPIADGQEIKDAVLEAVK